MQAGTPLWVFNTLAVCPPSVPAAPPPRTRINTIGRGSRLNMQLNLLLPLAAGSGAHFARVSLGDRLARDYTVYSPMPISVAAATAQGWRPAADTCLEGLGIPYAQKYSKNATNPAEPLLLYFTPGGQVSGAGVYVLGASKPRLVRAGFFLPAGKSGGYPRKYISVTFRAPNATCSRAISSEPLGDRLVINAGAGGIALELPLTRAEAAAAGWVRGSCFSGMGRHWFRDLSGPHLSWKAENLVPVVPMYDEESEGADGKINAFFFADPDRQQSLFPPSARQWEPIPLPTIAMCKNFCNSSCTFTDTSLFSTLHLYMRDHARVTCSGGCSIGCC